MKVIILLILSFGIILSLPSCTRTEDVACDTVSLGVMGIGFDTSGFDIAVVVRYKGDNMFDLHLNLSYFYFEINHC